VLVLALLTRVHVLQQHLGTASSLVLGVVICGGCKPPVLWDPVREGTDGSRRVTIFIAATMPEHKQWQLMEKGHTILRPSLSPNSFDTIF
jgi:hypothetical protein